MNINKDKNNNNDNVMPDIINGANNNDFEEIDAALARDVDLINFQTDMTGLAALHIAAGNGNHRMVDHLLSKSGVNPSITDKFGRDPLGMAIDIGHKGIIESLSKRLYPKSFAAIDDPDSSVVSFRPPQP